MMENGKLLTWDFIIYLIKNKKQENIVIRRKSKNDLKRRSIGTKKIITVK
jgi:hypothetical protein